MQVHRLVVRQQGPRFLRGASRFVGGLGRGAPRSGPPQLQHPRALALDADAGRLCVVVVVVAVVVVAKCKCRPPAAAATQPPRLVFFLSRSCFSPVCPSVRPSARPPVQPHHRVIFVLPCALCVAVALLRVQRSTSSRAFVRACARTCLRMYEQVYRGHSEPPSGDRYRLGRLVRGVVVVVALSPVRDGAALRWACHTLVGDGTRARQQQKHNDNNNNDDGDNNNKNNNNKAKSVMIQS
jgi:hypothetical protein